MYVNSNLVESSVKTQDFFCQATCSTESYEPCIEQIAPRFPESIIKSIDNINTKCVQQLSESVVEKLTEMKTLQTAVTEINTRIENLAKPVHDLKADQQQIVKKECTSGQS